MLLIGTADVTTPGRSFRLTASTATTNRGVRTRNLSNLSNRSRSGHVRAQPAVHSATPINSFAPRTTVRSDHAAESSPRWVNGPCRVPCPLRRLPPGGHEKPHLNVECPRQAGARPTQESTDHCCARFTTASSVEIADVPPALDVAGHDQSRLGEGLPVLGVRDKDVGGGEVRGDHRVDAGATVLVAASAIGPMISPRSGRRCSRPRRSRGCRPTAAGFFAAESTVNSATVTMSIRRRPTPRRRCYI